MALVQLRQPLEQLAGKCSARVVEGGTVVELLRELEREHPRRGRELVRGG